MKKFCARCFCFFEEDEKKKREAFLDACDFSATFRGDFSRKRVRVDEDIFIIL